MRFRILILLGLAVLLAGVAAADDATVKVLGTGSPTGTVTAVQPHATAVGRWIQVVGKKTDSTYLTFQLSGGAAATVVIQASMDGVELDTTHTLVEGEIYKIEAAGGTVFRAVCTAFTSGSPVVTAGVSGQAQLAWAVQP